MKPPKKIPARLRKKLLTQQESKSMETTVEAKKPFPALLDAAKASAPEAFEKISNKELTAIAKSLFQALDNQINATEDGNIVLPGIARFTVKQISAEENGTTVVKRKVIYKTLAQ
jgi:hypothetical protein